MTETSTLPDYPRGITFEQVWAGMMEDRDRQLESIKPEFVVSIPTAEEEVNIVLLELSRLKSMEARNYWIMLPNTSLFIEFENKLRADRILTNADRIAIKNHFINDVYDPTDYQPSFDTLCRVAERANKEIEKFIMLENSWGFNVPENYQVRMTLYGPCGRAFPDTGEMLIRINKKNTWVFDPLTTILHEAIHIGKSNIITQRYNVPHWTNERLVDLIGVKLIPDYIIELPVNLAELPIDIIFENPDVLDRLPYYVEEFMREHSKSVEK